jgi:hypothetical protein
MNDFQFPNVTESMIAKFLSESLKAGEISGEDTVRRDRMIELLNWFERYPHANGMWFVSHAYEILYYVATYARAPVPNLKVVANWLQTMKGDTDLPEVERLAAHVLLLSLAKQAVPVVPKPVSRKELEDTLGTCRRICAKRENPEEAAMLMCVECLLQDNGVPVETKNV